MRPGIVLVLGLVLGSPAAARALERLVVTQAIVHDGQAPARRTDDFLDTTFLVTGRQLHAALTLGSFAAGLQVGGFVRDGRGSAYGGLARRRMYGFVDDTTLEFETGQRLGAAVAQAWLRLHWPDRPETDNLLVSPGLGCELYYADASFASIRFLHDPRPGTGTTIRIGNRLAFARTHVDVVLAPRTDGVVNHAVAMRYGNFLLGYARERDFDFSSLDRRVWWFGFQYDLAP